MSKAARRVSIPILKFNIPTRGRGSSASESWAPGADALSLSLEHRSTYVLRLALPLGKMETVQQRI